MALYDGEVVGTVALVPMGSGSYELAKMAVDQHARGKDIGWELGRAVLERAREVGATSGVSRVQHDPRAGDQPVPETRIRAGAGWSLTVRPV